MTERNVLKGMIVLGLAFWLVSIAFTSIPMVVASAILVMWSVFHLLTLPE